MSRVGNIPVTIPSGVECKIEGKILKVKGPLGALTRELSPSVIVKIEGNTLTVNPANDEKHARAMWGTTRALVQNMVEGVSKGYTTNLDIVGVGYRAAMEGKLLILQLGYSHDVRVMSPEGITIKCEKPTAISISGADKQAVGQVAAVIRGYRRPEPYKGKGIKYSDEVVFRKEGKKK